jgi:hypothetical protein
MLIQVDAETAERARIKAELARARRSRYESKHPERKQRPSGRQAHRKYSDYDFIMWDGEAPKDTGYSLFGSSAGHEICHPHLSTSECFDLLLEAKREFPASIFVIFGGRYDSDEICRQSIPIERLSRLKVTGHCTWNGYTIRQAEGKFLAITKDGTTVRLWEIFGWFHKAYVKALADYQIGTEAERELLRSEKNRRAEFLWEDIEEIREYMRLELKLGPPLMEKIREICTQAGFSPRGWYGPSALALEALRKQGIRQYMPTYAGTIPADDIIVASQHAYAGGRFETIRGGILSPVYSVDENSAYMAAALELPDLASGRWRSGCEYEPGKFAVYHIRYDAPVDACDPGRIYPLFCRHANGAVSWPARVEGWYWAPEAELVKDDPCATFLEAYVYDEKTGYKPFLWIREWYRQRLVLESLPKSNPSRKAGKAFKWALASVYGQLARTVGYDRRRNLPPKYHCLEWAGYITSKCRADMFKVAKQAGSKLISIDTDSVTAMCPLTVPVGTQLGEWKAEQYDSGVFFQSGVFALQRDGEWVEQKRRGMEESRRGRPVVSPEMMISAMYDKQPVVMQPRTRYVSIRMALNHQLDKMGSWQEHPGDKLVFGGLGKRYHRESTCYGSRAGMAVCESAESHVFVPRPELTRSDWAFGVFPVSYPHLLPWRDDMSGELDCQLIADYLWIDPESIDEDDREWVSDVLR